VITVIERRRVDIRAATVPGTPWRNGMLMEDKRVPRAMPGVTTVFSGHPPWTRLRVRGAVSFRSEAKPITEFGGASC
jgi:hypothetical protein